MGTPVGILVGRKETVGWDEGAKVGVEVGLGVGALVGREVGLGVGETVGTMG